MTGRGVSAARPDHGGSGLKHEGVGAALDAPGCARESFQPTGLLPVVNDLTTMRSITPCALVAGVGMLEPCSAFVSVGAGLVRTASSSHQYRAASSW